MQCIGIFTIPFYFHSGDKKVFLLIKNMLNNKTYIKMDVVWTIIFNIILTLVAGYISDEMDK